MILNFLKSSYKKVRDALSKTRTLLGTKIRALFSSGLDRETFDKLEQLFYEADLGHQLSSELAEKIRMLYQANPDLKGEALLDAIRAELLRILSGKPTDLVSMPPETAPLVVLIIGVNGNGKTTTVAKLTRYFQQAERKVLVAGADTFRAAAMEQLEIWCNRLGADLVRGNAKSDPSAVVYDALSAGKSRNADVVIIDTAGRLHTKTHLMDELQKIRRTCAKVHPGSPHETLLVLDATTGQNALDQAMAFHQTTPISGLILTKLDGTAKGGIAISIYRKLGIPIKFIGIGEGLDDLEPFSAESFVQALFD